MGSSTSFKSIRYHIQDQIAIIEILRSSPRFRHWELGSLFSSLREDNSVRVIVLTGVEDGIFSAGPSTEWYESAEVKESRNDPAMTWQIFTGVIRCHEAMASIEKPIVARVNGDATTFGSSLVFASDMAVAWEDAVIADHHLGMGEVGIGSPYGVVPGDGGAALVPLHMPPMRAKEYLMLARQYTARELADMGYINFAVPMEELDDVVQEIVGRLLKRSAYALAWTKRVINRHIVSQLNRALDAGVAYEMVNFHQIELQDWNDSFSLGPNDESSEQL